MPGIELSGERRLLTLWLALSLLFGAAYYLGTPDDGLVNTLGLGGRQPFVQRFERAYYAVFWSRPFLSTEKDGLLVGVIAPQYISSLIDSEMWVWVRNTSPATTLADDDEINPGIMSPLVVVDYTSNIVPNPTATPQTTGTTSPTPDTPDSGAAEADAAENSPIEAQVLLREGEGRTDFYTQSRSAILFSDIYPGETTARLVWVRLMPIAYRQGKGEPSQPIYLSEQDISGTIKFDYTLWGDPRQPTGILDLEGESPEAKINTRQAVMRGFARTLLLPPWSNGLLIGLGLISAFLINVIVNFIDMRLLETDKIKFENRRNKSNVGIYEQSSEDKSTGAWQALFWVLQFIFWSFAVFSVFLLAVHLTEKLILCPMEETVVERQSDIETILPEDIISPELTSAHLRVREPKASRNCVRWPLWPQFYFSLAISVVFLYLGYLWKDTTLKDIGTRLKIFVQRVFKRQAPPPPPEDQHSPIQLTLNNMEKSLASLARTFTPGDIEEPSVNVVSEDPADEEQHDDRERMIIEPMVQELTNDIEVLSNDIEEFYRSVLERTDASLENHKALADEFRSRWIDIKKRENELPAQSNWHSSNESQRLEEINRSLHQLVGYLTLVKPAEVIISALREGDASGLHRLDEIREGLANNAYPFDLEPAKTLSAEQVQEIDATKLFYREYMERLHMGVTNAETLVIAIEKMENLRESAGGAIRVRFLTNSKDIHDEATGLMYLSEALDIAWERLFAHWKSEYLRMHTTFEQVPYQKANTPRKRQRALHSLEILKNNMAGWPESLPGWTSFPKPETAIDGQLTLREEIVSLIEQINDQIAVLSKD